MIKHENEIEKHFESESFQKQVFKKQIGTKGNDERDFESKGLKIQLEN